MARFDLSDSERIIAALLPNKPGVPRTDNRGCSMESFTFFGRVRSGATCRSATVCIRPPMGTSL
jgi:hypothetical protein